MRPITTTHEKKGTFPAAIDRGESGMSLLAVMVVIGIVGILAAAQATLLTHRNESTKSMEQKSELEDVRQYVRANLGEKGCKATLPNAAACVGTFIAVKRPPNRDGTPGGDLIRRYTGSAGATRIGRNYLLRARCPGRLRIEVSRVVANSNATANSDVAKVDQLTKKTLAARAREKGQWASGEWIDLFEAEHGVEPLDCRPL